MMVSYQGGDDAQMAIDWRESEVHFESSPRSAMKFEWCLWDSIEMKSFYKLCVRTTSIRPKFIHRSM